MNPAFQEYVHRLQTATDLSQLHDAMVAVTSWYDLPSFAYFARCGTGQRSTRLITNYPPLWREHYQARAYESADPVIARSQIVSDPFDWSADLAASDERALRFFEEASDFGIRYGRTVPIHDRRGWVAAVTYATDKMDFSYRDCVERNADALQLIAVYFHAQAQRAFDLNELYRGPHLTDREAECLYWASLGKSAPDIGGIIGLSESTVKFHLKNVRAKYRVSTTIQAAIAFDRAQRRGQVICDD
jgi:LuxR family transcriptional activator of conjugal transfer of Ti plasmids